MTPILNSILLRLGLLKSYRVHNELTGESFVVTGRNTKGCLYVANKMCDQLGWDDQPPHGVCWSEREPAGRNNCIIGER